ncbi:uncharacterized protein LOC106380320 isoform X2 [Brassica napus]|uniref:uncharacterized protein LOC106380320 isoform X2 n=1 Tax=Brassica napus TaxID=3708 RepID=UPI000BBEEFB0|nr:uncharacterized protein LOC106380320 isoform X2 [Brassica napus]
MSWCDSAAKTGKNIAVWWDMKDCPVPEGIDAHRVRPSIEGALKEQGYSGPVSITAYGDQKQTPDRLLRALSSTGVAVVHIRSESTCAVMYKDMVKWREDNPPPATMMIITNQMLDVFHWDLARLQQRTSYDLFLAYSVEPLARLFVYTRKNWLWKNILLGTTASVTSSSSDAVFYCKSCSLECLSLKSFKKHLSTEEHAIQEVLHPQPKQLISVTSKWGKNYAATPEYATAKIHVWWDMFDCPIPDGYDAHRVRPSLEGAFKELGYSGPVSITAFGDYKKTPKSHLHALSSTGIDVAHVIPEVIYSRMHNDIFKWREDNPTPATMMIISDEAKYVFGTSLALRAQQDNKYNLFWAYSFRPREMSVMVTSAEWLWDSLLAETKRHVLRKCSGSSERVVESTGIFYCKLCVPERTLCFYKHKLLDEFIKHLSSKKHLSKEKGITDRRQRNMNLGLFWLEKEHFPESKRLKKSA